MYSNVNAPITAGANIAPTPSYVSPAMYVAPTYTVPAYGYCYSECPSRGCGGFTLIVVLFILLIIVGASFCHHKC